MVIRKCDVVFAALAVLVTAVVLGLHAAFDAPMMDMNKGLLGVMYISVGATFFYGRR